RHRRRGGPNRPLVPHHRRGAELRQPVQALGRRVAARRAPPRPRRRAGQRPRLAAPPQPQRRADGEPDLRPPQGRVGHDTSVGGAPTRLPGRDPEPDRRGAPRRAAHIGGLAPTHANDSANQVRSIMALMSRDTLSLDAMAGAVLEDKYKLIRVLGSGAMAHVYEAEQLRLGRSVAVKIMRVALVSDKRSVERFRTEALAASRINHPNAIAIYDVGVTKDGVPFMVMEHLRGTTLAETLGERPLSVERIVSIGAQILSALEEAHGCGVIHRDLKSENVVLEQRRDGTDLV